MLWRMRLLSSRAIPLMLWRTPKTASWRKRIEKDSDLAIGEGATVGERVTNSVARFGGSWAFITSLGVFMLVYISINVSLGRSAWNHHPFIPLNLFLSMLAAIQAPVIMVSQNRQEEKDRVRSELDFEVNRKAESEIHGLARKLNVLNDKMGDLEGLLRQKRLAD